MADSKNSDIAMAFARESGSSSRNKLYAARFKKEGKMPLAGLLNAIAESEEIQARRAFMHLRGKIDDPARPPAFYFANRHLPRRTSSDTTRRVSGGNWAPQVSTTREAK